MIQIEIFNPKVPGGRGFANLFEKTRVNFVIENLAILSTVIPGEYTLPIEFPRHNFNDVLFDYIHEIPISNRTSEFRAWVYFKGVPLYKGTLVLVESGATHDGYIRINIAGLSCLKMKLKDLNLGEMELGATEAERYDNIGLKLDLIYPVT